MTRMRIDNDALRDALAAEYVLGTLRGAARRRFERAMRDDAALRTRVQAWQERLAPLDAATQPVEPPARVWRSVEARIGARRSTRAGWWVSVRFWRGAALAGFLLAGVLAASLGVLLPRQPPMMVVVMSDQSAQPAMTVSWRMNDPGRKRLRIRVIGHAEMAPDTAWELWALPREGGAPVSLGLITTHETQSVMLPPQLARLVNAAEGMAMSVEPKGGSPTGLPTGPVLYKGLCTQL
jgi:anti-sigma-K factor RskA